jgi:hypothetical protein
MTAAGLCIPAAVRTFSPERRVHWREANSGANRIAYFLGKALADIPKVVVLAFMYIAPLIMVAPWRGPPEYLYAAVLVHDLAMFAVGYCLAAVFLEADDANLLGVILAILLNLFG